jgi:hypothetical protein
MKKCFLSFPTMGWIGMVATVLLKGNVGFAAQCSVTQTNMDKHNITSAEARQEKESAAHLICSQYRLCLVSPSFSALSNTLCSSS